MGVQTKLFIEVEAGEITDAGVPGYDYTGYDLNKEPLTSLLKGLIPDVVLGILLEIGRDEKVRFEIELLANINLRNVLGFDAQIAIDCLSLYDADLLEYTKTDRILQLNLHNGQLYFDASYINGPKLVIENFMGKVMGEEEFQIGFLTSLFGTTVEDEVVEEIEEPTNSQFVGPRNALPGAVGQLPIDINFGTKLVFGSIATHGLALSVSRVAINTLLRFLNQADLQMFSEVIAMIYLAPKLNSFIVGVDIGADALGREVLGLGLGIDGLCL